MYKETLLQYLPPFQDHHKVIEDDQSVHDIIKEVLSAHEAFANDYDCIAELFPLDRSLTVANYLKRLFDFCKENIDYEIESEEYQTTRSPAATLTMGYGDCKHYAGFIAGIIDANNRNGYKVDWCYRFSSYDIFEPTPGHVFVVVKERGKEFWIDPVLKTFNERLEPFYIVDKKPKMLTRISGMQFSTDILNSGSLSVSRNLAGLFGKVSVVDYATNGNGGAANPYFEGIPFLGLSSYVEDGGTAILTNWQELANEINADIAAGPSPGHSYNADFVKWVYDNNIKGWNFYFFGGVPVGYNPDAMLPAGYPRIIITEDGRLTFDRNVQVDDAHSNEIHAIWAKVQDLINRFDTQDAAPMKPAVLKGFSQGKFGGIDGGNLFTQYRGSSIFEQVGKFLEDAMNFIKDIGIKITMTPFRNAFLGLVAINALGMARSLQNKITAGKWNEMAATWKSIGGNPDKLKNTIDDGYNKPETLSGIGSVEALLAAAAPVIAIMIKYLDKEGKLKEVFDATKGIMKDQFGIDIDEYGALFDNSGNPVNYVIDPSDDENKGGGNNQTTDNNFMDIIKKNPEISAAGAAALTWFLARKSKSKMLFALLAGAGVYFIAKKSGDDRISEMLAYFKKTGESGLAEYMQGKLSMMTSPEIDTMYDFFINWVKNGKTLADIKTGNPTLYNKVIAIDSKYQILGT